MRFNEEKIGYVVIDIQFGVKWGCLEPVDKMLV